MAETSYTGFRSTDGVLASLNADGQNLVIENDGKSYYSYWTAGALSTISIDATAPTTIFLSVTPSVQSTLYAGLLAYFAENVNGDSITVSALAGLVANVSVDGAGSVTFDYTSPAQATDTITVAGSDLAGNAFSIDTALALLV